MNSDPDTVLRSNLSWSQMRAMKIRSEEQSDNLKAHSRKAMFQLVVFFRRYDVTFFADFKFVLYPYVTHLEPLSKD